MTQQLFWSPTVLAGLTPRTASFIRRATGAT